MSDKFIIAPENLPIVLSEFFKIFKGNPLAFVSMDESISLFDSIFGKNEDENYEVSEQDIKDFLDKINGMQTDRLMVSMDKAGLATLGHDGEDICLIRKK